MTRAVRGPLSILLLCGLGCVGVTSATAVYHSALSVRRGTVVSPIVITVTAGKPTELAFTLSRSSMLPWTAQTPAERMTFKVTNRGELPHNFKVCTTPVEQANANTCYGDATRSLEPGQSTTLTIIFKRRGIYEYLCTVSGEAADGMKGLIGVGVRSIARPAPISPVPSTTTTTTTTATSTTPVPSNLVGDPNSGEAVFSSAGCGSCHTLAAAGASGTVGPSLDMVKPTQPVIVEYVTYGSNASGNSMPAYAGTLTTTEIDDLAAYIFVETHTIN
jgi:mono/diheme cytochrome c family protein/uncharacterized cupredoxin-like copper-binding protein